MKKKFFTGLFITATLGFIIFAHLVFQHNDAQYQPQQNLNAPIEIPSENVVSYDEIQDFEKPIVAMFYVDWCTYCRKYMPTFGKLANEYKDKYTFAVINCDYPHNMQLINKFHIMSFPSFFIIDKKYNYSFSLNAAVTTDLSIIKSELDNYLEFKNKLLNN